MKEAEIVPKKNVLHKAFFYILVYFTRFFYILAYP